MDVRELHTLLMDAEALRRQELYRLASAVRAGMAEMGDYRMFVEQLELTRSKQEAHDSTWDILSLMGR